jgi:hypothetical protein
MKTTTFYFTVDLPEVGMALTWIGGGLQRSKRDGHVWLTTPGGEPVLEVPRGQVHPSNPEEVARRIVQERRLVKAPLN